MNPLDPSSIHVPGSSPPPPVDLEAAGTVSPDLISPILSTNPPSDSRPLSPDNVSDLNASEPVEQQNTFEPLEVEELESLKRTIDQKNQGDSSAQNILYQAWKTGQFSSIKSNLAKDKGTGIYQVGTYIKEGGNPEDIPQVCYKIEVTYTLVRKITEGDPQEISFTRTLYTTESVESPPDKAILAASKYKDLVMRMAQETKGLVGFSDNDEAQKEILRNQKSFSFYFDQNKDTELYRLSSIKLSKKVDGVDKKLVLKLTPRVKAVKTRFLQSLQSADNPSSETVKFNATSYRYLSKEESIKHAPYKLVQDDLLSKFLETGHGVSWVDSAQNKIQENLNQITKMRQVFEETKASVKKDSDFLKTSLADIEYMSTEEENEASSSLVKQYAEGVQKIGIPSAKKYSQWESQLQELNKKDALSEEEERSLTAIEEGLKTKEAVSKEESFDEEIFERVPSRAVKEVKEEEPEPETDSEGEFEVQNADKPLDDDVFPALIEIRTDGDAEFGELANYFSPEGSYREENDKTSRIEKNLTILREKLGEGKENRANLPENLKRLEKKIDTNLNAFKLKVAEFQRLNHNILILHEQLNRVKTQATEKVKDSLATEEGKKANAILNGINENALKKFKEQYDENQRFISQIIDRISGIYSKTDASSSVGPGDQTEKIVIIKDGIEESGAINDLGAINDSDAIEKRENEFPPKSDEVGIVDHAPGN